MRKDYIETDHITESETDFVERFWTENWKKTGGVESHARRHGGRFDMFSLKSEWRNMKPFLLRLPGARILDAGCGTGEWARYLNEREYQVLGLDISEETVEQLQKLFPDNDFQAGDIRDTGLDNESFDAIISWGTFEHFEDGVQSCMNEAYRLLSPGGYLFITVPFDSFGLALKSLWEGTQTEPVGAPSVRRFYQWRFSRAEIAEELSIAGFEILRTRPIHRRQGVVRFFHHVFGLDYSARTIRIIGILLGLVLPRSLCSHMLMAVARKPIWNTNTRVPSDRSSEND